MSNTVQDKYYSTFIILSFIWNPSLARKINKLEQMQQRAAKLVPELAQLPYMKQDYSTPYMKQDYSTVTRTPCTARDKEGI